MKRTILLIAILCVTANQIFAEDPVYFADANLKAAVEAALGKSDPTPSDMLGLTSLSAYSQGIADLTGVEYATNLTELDLTVNQISNISILSGLTNLTELHLGGNQISDISVLSGLTNLERLDLWDNQISDISVLSGLTNLEGLDLSYTNINISDISVLSGLTNLESLGLSGNQISDIVVLSGMTNLEWLDLSDNQISDISTLSGLTNLRGLYLSGNQISDISVLSGFTNLEWLDLSVNHIKDISPLSGMTNLHVLNLTYNPLNSAAYTTYIPLIYANNPNIDFSYSDRVYEYALIISSSEGGTVIKPREGFFPYDTNEVVVIEATSDNEMYPFTGWTGSAVDHGKVADPLAMQTTVLVDGVYTLEATFGCPWETVYLEDFEEGAGPEWSQRITDFTPIGERGFLGQFDNTVVTLTLNNLPPHTKIRLSFDLFIIQTWDGLDTVPPPEFAGYNPAAPDIWTLEIEGSTVLNTTFGNGYIYPYTIWHRQSYPLQYVEGQFLPQTGAIETNTLGYQWEFLLGGGELYNTDAVYHLTFDVPHDALDCLFDFMASGLTGIGDESWGLDNVHVSILNTPGG
jgi:hypothetical protein